MNRIELLSIIKQHDPDTRMILPGGMGNVLLVDESYYVPDESEVNKLIHWRKWWQVWIKPSYVPEYYDCDDIALECYRDVRGAYRGNGVLAFGLCHIPGHALNFLVTQQGIWLYDLDRAWKATNEQIYFWMI